MTSTSVLTAILITLRDFGSSLLTIVVAVLVVAGGYLVFRYGWKTLGGDMSLNVGGFYPFNTPFKGYHRFRSQKWNMQHMEMQRL